MPRRTARFETRSDGYERWRSWENGSDSYVYVHRLAAVAWAGAVIAASVKTMSRSDAAKHAATADSYRQRAESRACDQENHQKSLNGGV